MPFGGMAVCESSSLRQKRPARARRSGARGESWPSDYTGIEALARLQILASRRRRHAVASGHADRRAATRRQRFSGPRYQPPRGRRPESGGRRPPNIARKIGPSGRAFRCAVAVRVIGGSGANRLHPGERGIRVTLAGPPRLRPCGPDFRADDRRASSKGRRPLPSGRR